MRYSYARVSSDDQNLDRRRVALAREDCAELIEEKRSGVTARHRLDADEPAPVVARDYGVTVKTLRATSRR